ncbi:6178_t:CDS:2 [Entrophospora sp. SA101]|nr:40_t:CDS:2 [Entrophospora sp. SA101]CAJ0841433.1 6178_t:CDS:2 [Entrophospora sp. SA101]
MDIHSLQEALKNPNLTTQARQEKETKLNYYSNLLRAPISVSPMVRSSSMPLNTLTSTGALSSQTGPILTNNTVSTMQQQQQFSSASQTTSQSPTAQIPLHLQQVPITSAITTNFSPSLTLSSNAYLTSNLPLGTSQLQIADSDNIEKPIVAKCNIQELVEQIDPRERLEPEVEDLLLDVADEFITSVASFACQLAKHRKTDTLEVKDLQLHLERNWNIRIPGFASDEIRSVRKPVIATAHQQKLAAVNNAQAQSH